MSSSDSPSAFSNSSFNFDGSSSDMAQHFYNLYQQSAQLLPLKLSAVPDDLQARLDAHSLKFANLPPLLQRAVVWDTGYVAQYNNSAQLATIYTPCSKSLTMADLALSVEAYEASGCPVKPCNATDSSRSYNCPSTSIKPQSLCASTDVIAGQNAAMWATGGTYTMVPVPTVVRHDWWVPANRTGDHYIMFAIHMFDHSEVDYESCPTDESTNSMIIPCVALANATKSDWCRPSTGSLVEAWLSVQPSSSTTGSSNPGLIAGASVGAAVILGLLIGIWMCFRRKMHAKRSERTLRTYSSAITPNSNHRVEIVASLTTPPLENGLWSDPAIAISRIPLEKVVVETLVSQGGYGEVYRGTYRGELVAIKMLQPGLRNDVRQINAFLSEAKIMASIEHQRIVPFIGVAWDSLRDICVVSKFMEGGDLRSLLKQFEEDKRLQGFDADKTKIAMHVAHALTYLHSLQPIVIHRDLKSRNILLDNEWNAKLTDFGVSRETTDQTMTAGVGTSLWMAPEIMLGERYDEKADIFSFGVVLTELDSHLMPYASAKSTNSGRSLPDTAILQQVAMGRLRAQFSPKAPKWLVDLGEACLSLDPRARPSAAQLLYALQTRSGSRLV